MGIEKDPHGMMDFKNPEKIEEWVDNTVLSDKFMECLIFLAFLKPILSWVSF